MNNVSHLKPKTLGGLKRKAKHLQKLQGIPLNQAQELAAQQCGFASYHEARSILTKSGEPGFDIEIDRAWRDDRTKMFGLERLTFKLNRKLSDFPPRTLNRIPYLAGHKDGDQRFVSKLVHYDKNAARMFSCRSARALQFADATNLIEAASRKACKLEDRVPYEGLDHVTGWQDRETKQTFLIDEPYTKLPKSDEDEWIVQRKKACAEHGLIFVKPDWAGIYWPDVGCGFYMIFDEQDGAFAERVLADLKNYRGALLEKDAQFSTQRQASFAR